jgi:hypothetical protein
LDIKDSNTSLLDHFEYSSSARIRAIDFCFFIETFCFLPSKDSLPRAAPPIRLPGEAIEEPAVKALFRFPSLFSEAANLLSLLII